ncbi:MAG TPA: tartrate-resistant acid phosphatase type 5 family protein [Candidatus Aquilonibacter sp.]|nr:tartrate-resistant acid phosphatase type 5 family protein [Candidatus Aquilonibacter sp.]
MKQSRRDFVRTLFVATQAAVAGRFLPGTLEASIVAEPPARPGGLNFLVFGDWGRNGETDQANVAVQMAIAAKLVGAKFVISVGDNFYEDGVASTDDKQWQTSFEKVYNAPSLQVPWPVILGNHDYHGNCDAQIAYSQISRRWQMPARYFVRSEKIDAATTADFFYLDTTPMIKKYYDVGEKTRANVHMQDVPKQMAWFKDALAKSTAQWKFVIGHHPIYSGGEHGDTPELIESVLPLLHEYNVQAYFNGHDHDLQHLEAGAVNFFDSGAGSRFRATAKSKYTKFAEGCSGFTAVTLEADQMRVRMIDIHGTLLYTATVPRVS